MIVFILLLITVGLQLLDYFYHREDVKHLASTGSMSYKLLRTKLRGLNYKKYDNYFAPLPFIWTYLLIISSIIVFIEYENWLIRFALILFVTGRYRSLQEISHFAVHGALCPHLKWGLFLANIFYQFPLCMPEANQRRQIHVRQHHRSVNMPHDPDLHELIEKNLKPGISSTQFWSGVLYPLSWAGFKNRIMECFSYMLKKNGSRHFYLRMMCVGTIVFLFIKFADMQSFVFLYLVPLLVTYPLFYWIAHLVLHRWYAPCEINIEYYERELELGRATEFKGVIGFIIRHHVFPFGDSYHLAHSLFPMIRWNHLSQVDHVLKKCLPNYSKNQSCNLVLTRSGKPSALSELQKRLVSK